MRDKDAVQAVLLLCEAANYYKARGATLVDALLDIQRRHGFFAEGQLSISAAGADGPQVIARVMRALRTEPPTRIAGDTVAVVEDYLSGQRVADGVRGTLAFPRSDVLKFILGDGDSWVAVRPSGTEPKCKVYFCARGNSAADAQARYDAMRAQFSALV